MPSKRKKNKRRMRRVQAQRRALEDQHAANPPIKTGPGIAASTPPTAPKKAAKTEKKIPQAVPVVAPVVQIPKAEPELVVKEPEPVLVQAAEAEPEILDRAPAEVKAEPRASSDFEVEARAGVTEKPPVEWTPPVEPSIAQTGVLQEVIVPQPEPVSEIKPPDEAAAGVPAVTETQTIEAVLTETEAEQSYDVCEPEAEEEAETFGEETMEVRVEVEEDVTDFCVAEPGTEATKEPAAEDFSSDQVSAQAETEAIAETPKPEESTEPVGPGASAQEGERSVEAVLVEEDKAAVCAEPVTAAELTDTILEALQEEAEAAVTEAREELAESLVGVVSESTPGVEDVITPAVIQQEITATSDKVRTRTESITGTPADPEPAAAPTSDAADQMCLNVSSEEPKSEVCDVPCQIQLPVEPVQHDSVEITVETTLNGHMVPEVSIEG